MTKVKILAKPHYHQKVVHDDPARFKVLFAGRRWGKTRLGVHECLEVGSSGGRAWWVSPSYKTALVGWRPLQRIARKIPGVVIRKVERIIEFPGGGTVSVRSADNPDSLRGDGLDFVVKDECAFMREEAWTDALRPALSDRKGRGLFITTPKGHNWVWRLWLRGKDEEEEQWKAFQFPTVTNPFIDPEEIEEARRTLPDRVFRQEYLAEPIDDAGGVFRGVMDVATGVELQEPEENRQYIAAVDVATLVDFTVITVWDVEAERMVYMDRFNRVDYSILEDRLEALYNRWKLSAMIIEANSIGQSVIEAMVERDLMIIPFVTSNATKTAIVQNLQAGLEHKTVTLLSDPILVGELQAFEGKWNGMRWTYSAPAGLHDDCVMSTAIGYDAIGKPAGADLVGTYGLEINPND